MRDFRTFTTCIVASSLLLTSAGTAQAHDPTAPASEVAETIAAVAPEVGELADVAMTSGAFTAQTAATTVSVPAETGLPVEISNADPAVPDVGIDLPELSGSSAAQEASDGTLVYTSDGDDASLAIQAAADGSTRFLSILESRDAPERYEYTFDGVDLQLLDDGSVLTTHRGAIVGVIQAAWALDANGSPVPTHYEVEGSTLTQVVSHRQGEYAYPVTADPTLSFGWRMYWTLSATEQRYLTVAGAAGGGGALCSATGALACGVATAAAAVIIQWINERGSICKAPRSRLQVGIPYGWPQVKSGKVTMACIK